MILRVRYWRVALSIASFLPASCTNTPESYSVPEQHQPFRAHSVDPEFVLGGARGASQFFVRDIRMDTGLWRWTGAEPELEFTLITRSHRRLLYEFVIHEETFKHTGPVTISFFVNDRLLARERYDAPGDKKLERVVPDEWLQSREKTRVLARVQNTWRSPDGVIFGILLKRAGFLE